MTDINWLRRDAELTREDLAALCAVNLRTVQRWESGATDCPGAVEVLLRLMAGDLSAQGWDGWTLRKGQLWTPEMPRYRAGLTPARVRAGEWLLQQTDFRTWRTLTERAGRTPAANVSGAYVRIASIS